MSVTATLVNTAFGTRVAPLVRAGALALADVHVVDRLGARAGETDVDVLLALAFAMRAPRHGHTGVNLRMLAAGPHPVTTPSGHPETFAWPDDVDAWIAAVRGSPLVRDGTGEPLAGEEDPHPAALPFRYEHGMVQIARMASYEARLAGALRQRAAPVDPDTLDVARLRHDLTELFVPLGHPPHDPAPPLSVDMQVLAATMCVVSRTTVISGGPGTGKTTTIRKVLAALYEQARARGMPSPRVALAAPTGKAAARMGDSLSQLPNHATRPPRGISEAAWAWLTALVPTTLHRLLGWQPRTPSRFRHDAEHPLPFDIVVVDEASMVDVGLMCKLVEAVPPGGRLILLGDRNQLVSVEAGSALADVTAGSGRHGVRLPPHTVEHLETILGEGTASAHLDTTAPPLAGCMVHFTRAFRFESAALRTPIYALADASSEAADPTLEAHHLARALSALLDCALQDRPAAGDDRPNPAGADVRHRPHAARGRRLAESVLDDIVDAYAWILQPLRRDGSEATRRLVLQRVDSLRVLAAHRSGPLGVDGLNRTISLALGRRLGVSASELATGRWTGRMLLVTENDYEHDLWNGDIGLVLHTPARTDVIFPGRDRGAPTRVVGAASMPAHETAFAMTIHKSQGSQFDHAVVVLPEASSSILTRELVYTGISRARARLTICGSPEILRDALRRRVERATSLHLRLWAPEHR